MFKFDQISMKQTIKKEKDRPGGSLNGNSLMILGWSFVITGDKYLINLFKSANDKFRNEERKTSIVNKDHTNVHSYPYCQ